MRARITRQRGACARELVHRRTATQCRTEKHASTNHDGARGAAPSSRGVQLAPGWRAPTGTPARSRSTCAGRRAARHDVIPITRPRPPERLTDHATHPTRRPPRPAPQRRPRGHPTRQGADAAGRDPDLRGGGRHLRGEHGSHDQLQQRCPPARRRRSRACGLPSLRGCGPERQGGAEGAPPPRRRRGERQRRHHPPHRRQQLERGHGHLLQPPGGERSRHPDARRGRDGQYRRVRPDRRGHRGRRVQLRHRHRFDERGVLQLRGGG